jgi:hypothetical protein
VLCLCALRFAAWLSLMPFLSSSQTPSGQCLRGQFVSTLNPDGSFACASPATVVDMSNVQPRTIVATYSADFTGPNPKPGWSYLWNANGTIGNFNNYVPLRFGTALYTFDGFDQPLPRPAPAMYLRLGSNYGHTGLGSAESGSDGIARAAIVGYTVPWDASYAIVASSADATNDVGCSDGVSLQVYRNNDLIRTLQLQRSGSSSQSFDVALGRMRPTDTIYIVLNPLATFDCDTVYFDFSVEATMLPVVCDGSTGACTPCPPGSQIVAGACQLAGGDSVWNFEGSALDLNRRLDGALANFGPTPYDPVDPPQGQFSLQLDGKKGGWAGEGGEKERTAGSGNERREREREGKRGGIRKEEAERASQRNCLTTLNVLMAAGDRRERPRGPAVQHHTAQRHGDLLRLCQVL